LNEYASTPAAGHRLTGSSHADAAAALESVAGYTVGNDVSGWDWQQDTPTMWPGESFDTHGPIGPWVVTADEVDPAVLGIRTWVDSELRQDGSTKEMVTGIGDMIAALSAFARWSPATSSPPARPAAPVCFSGRLLQPGQRVRVEIEAIGAIENPVVAEPSPELSGLNTSTVGMLGAMATKACRSRSSDTSELMDNVRIDELWVCPLTPIAIATVTQFIGLGRDLVATWHTLARRTSKISQKPL
jgi:hypothetical protein